MIDLDGIHKMWKEDAQIGTKLDQASEATPTLHAKYLEILSQLKLQKRRAENAQKVLLKQKWLYYNGKMDQEQIAELGWEFDPFNGLKVLKGEMEEFLEEDEPPMEPDPDDSGDDVPLELVASSDTLDD